MDLISAAERLAAREHSAVVFNPDRCLLAIDKFSSCDRCFEICPKQAIQPGSPSTIQSEDCHQCLACLLVCPTGAFTAEDELSHILTCLTRMPSGPVEILCTRNPHPEWGISGANAIRIRHCLAGIGAGGYMAMVALNVGSLFVRLEACQDCPVGTLSDQVERQIDQANSILQELNQLAAIQRAKSEALTSVPGRQVWDAHDPPISRRDLFRMIGASGQTPLVRSLALENQAETRQPRLDNRRIVAAVHRLIDRAVPPTSKIEGRMFASLQVDPECTACGTCVRSCPNGALEIAFDQAEQQYILAIRPSDCNGCEVCLHVCSPQAIHINHTPTYQEIFTSAAFHLLSEGSLQRCTRCNQLFAPVHGSTLCPVCAYRRENPFSTGLPHQPRPDQS